MIQAVFFTGPSGELTGFRLTGHSGLAEEGSDILCAAVSLRRLYDCQHRVRRDPGRSKDHSRRRIYERGGCFARCKRCRDLFEGFKLHLQGLEEQYPENIEVSYLEV